MPSFKNMDLSERNKMFRQIVWDYNISPEEIAAVIRGEKKKAGHYTREMLFQKIIESYPWFTIIQIFTPNEVLSLLTDEVIKKLRSESLRKKYEFVRKRLHQIIPASR
jgi:hypothetical protein